MYIVTFQNIKKVICHEYVSLSWLSKNGIQNIYNVLMIQQSFWKKIMFLINGLFSLQWAKVPQYDFSLSFWACVSGSLCGWLIISYLNNIHSTIKFTSDRSTTSIPYPDVNIQLENKRIETDLFCKPTDKHQ